MLKDARQTAAKIAQWIKERAEAAGRDTLVVGVSGGIDSAVTYRLCQMTGLKVVPVFLPFDGDQMGRLRPLIQALLGEDVYGKTRGAYVEDCLFGLEGLRKTGEGDLSKAEGNFSARIRMAMLYFVAELVGGLVVGTTNLAEWVIGYFTKWGDGAVDLEPLRDLTKAEVYQLGREGFDVPVPDCILEAAPSANLWEGQTDEGELGFTYGDLDAYCLRGEQGCSPESLAGIERWAARSEHKRCETPHFDLPAEDRVIEFSGESK